MPFKSRADKLAYLKAWRQKQAAEKPPRPPAVDKKAYLKAWRQLNKAEISIRSRIKNQRLKEEVIRVYGGKCSCGQDILEFLLLDHVNDDGSAHRAELGKRNIYRWARLNNYPSTLQVLCWNCNMRKAQALVRRTGPVTAAARSRRRLRQRVLSAYGSRCNCCGVTEDALLCLDRISGGDCALRRAGVDPFMRAVQHSHEYRCLCFNCNFSAAQGKGVCVHQRAAQNGFLSLYRAAGILHPDKLEVRIEREVLRKLRQGRTNDELTAYLNEAITLCQIPPPHRTYTASDIQEDWVRLTSSQRATAGMSVSGSVSEPYRWAAIDERGQSAAQVWADPTKRMRIISGIGLAGDHAVGSTNLRRYTILNAGMPTQFRPMVARQIYEKYGGGGRVLDCCAGWGDRLVGFWASSATEYVGIDPNADLQPMYEDQVRLLISLGGVKASSFVQAAVEDVPAGSLGQFDLGFTSPPYFRAEKYSTHAGQSWVRYPQYDAWVAGFLQPMLSMQAACCRTVIVNIADACGKPIEADTVRVAAECGLRLIETERYALPTRPGGQPRSEPIFIFQR